MPKNAGFFPDRHAGQDVGKLVDRSRHAPGPGASKSPSRHAETARSELLDAGPFDQRYEQWSKGDLMNRARQLGVQGAFSHEELIEKIRAAESRPQNKGPAKRTARAPRATSRSKR